MAVKSAEHAQEVYDRVAAAYDDLWSKHVAEPNAKLTRGLRLKRGERLADLACGTGAFTLEMADAVAPGETIGVDYSAGMLAAARDRANDAGLKLSLVHAKAEDFLESCAPESLDVVSCRFMLAYVDFEDVVPRMARVVRKGGRVAVLTSLSNSIPQAQQLYSMFMQSFGASNIELPSPVPETQEHVARLLEKGGLVASEKWTSRIRLWFDNGMQAAHWMRESGYATHPSLGPVDVDALRNLEQLFAAGMEASFREPQGVPLDLVVAGVIAEKR